jgi:protocatechuate 3,4-dioxygenase beta subunit
MKNLSIALRILAAGCALSAAADTLVFQGKVDLPKGAAPSDFRVCLEHHDGRDATPPATFLKEQVPAADGTFLLETEKNDEQYSLYVRDAAGRVLTGFPHLGKSRQFGTIKLELDGQVSGLVLSPEGTPMKDLPVRLERKLDAECSHYLETQTLKTDADGTFLFDKLPLGHFLLRVVSDQYSHPPHKVELTGDLNYSEIRLFRAASISGLVKLLDGKPAAGVLVRADDKPPVTTDAQGHYRIGGLGPESYNLTVRTETLAMAGQARLEVKVGTNDVTARDIVLVEVGSFKLSLKQDQADRPLPGKIAVSLSTKSRQGSSSRTLNAAVSNGVAVFQKIAPGTYDVSLDDELGEAKTSVTVESGKEAAARLTLPTVFSLGGQVLNQQGKPVSNAVIRFYANRGMGGNSVHRYDHSEDGQFMLKGIPQVEGTLNISSPAKVPFDQVMTVSNSVTNLTVTLMDGLTVKGRLVDEKSTPVAGATVKLEAKQDMRSGMIFSSDNQDIESAADGSFSLSGMTGGWYTVEVDAKEHIGDFKAVLISATNLNLGNLVLKTGMSIAGSVMEADGKPMAEGSVNVSSMARRKYISKQGDIEPDGSFRVSGLPEGKYTVTVSREKYGNEEMTTPDVMAGTDDLIISLGLKHPVKVRVTDSAGNPVADAEISVDRQAQSVRFSSSRSEQKTDAQGIYTVDLRQGAQYHIRSQKPPLLEGKQTVDLTKNQKAPAEIVLKMEEGLTVSGLVVDAEGKPKPNVFVGIEYNQLEQADAAGRFKLEGVAPGLLNLTVYADEDRQTPLGEKRLQISREKPPAEVRIELGRSGSLKGVVRNSKGEPVAGTTVMLNRTDEMTGRSGYQKTTESDGLYAFDEVVPGKYMLMTMDMSGKSMRPEMQQVEVKAGETTTADFPAKTKTGMKISGLATVAGKPLPDTRIYFMPLDKDKDPMSMAFGMYQEPTKILENGRYEVELAGPGAYLACIYRQKEPMQVDGENEIDAMEAQMEEPLQYKTKVQIAAGQTNVNIDITGGTITGLVEDPDGKPLTGAIVVITLAEIDSEMMDYMGSRFKTDTAGRFAAKNLPLALHRVKIIDDEKKNIAETNLTPAANAVETRIRLKPGLLVTGKVNRSTDEESRQTLVLVLDEQGHILGGDNAENEGAYEINPSLPAGRYHLICVNPLLSAEVVALNLTSNVTHDFNLKPGGEIQVELKGDKKLIANRTIRITDKDGKEVVRLKNSLKLGYLAGMLGGAMLKPTNENGQTVIKGLPAGDYGLSVDGSTASAKATVKPLESVTATMTVTP